MHLLINFLGMAYFLFL
jgi:hypothetical protein